MFDYRKEAEDIWNELKKYKIKRKVKELDYELTGKQTNGFIVFNFNLIKIMAILYTTFHEDSFDNITEPETKNYFLKIPFEFIIITLITSFEVYLRTVFLDILSYSNYPDIEEQDKKLLKIKNQNLEIEEDYFHTREIINENILRFQDNEMLKEYYKIIGMNITRIIGNIDRALWERIFGDCENNLGYLKIRHNLTHKGSVFARNYLCNLDMTFIKKFIIDIVKFIFALENEIVKNYPKEKNYGRVYYL